MEDDGNMDAEELAIEDDFIVENESQNSFMPLHLISVWVEPITMINRIIE